MIAMRMKLPELMAAHRLRTAYALAKFSEGLLTLSTATRLVEADGRPKRVDMVTLQALSDIFDVDPNDLLEREPKPRRR